MSILFKEYAVKNAKKQAVLVDKLTEATPILNAIPMQVTSDGLHHVFEELQNVVGGDFTEVDGILTQTSSDTELGQVDLKMAGGRMKVTEDKAKKLGGKDAYFAMKFPPVLRKTGMNLEISMVETLRQYAIDNSNVVKGNGAASANSSIVAVTWVEGEVQGLIDPDFFKNGMFEITDLSGGQLYEDTDGTAMGLLLANPDYVSAYVNVTSLDSDADSGLTSAKIDSLLDKCRRGNGTTVLYMPPSLFNREFKNLKSDSLTFNNQDNNIFKAPVMYDDVPIITSYNLPYASEATVS